MNYEELIQDLMIKEKASIERNRSYNKIQSNCKHCNIVDDVAAYNPGVTIVEWSRNPDRYTYYACNDCDKVWTLEELRKVALKKLKESGFK